MTSLSTSIAFEYFFRASFGSLINDKSLRELSDVTHVCSPQTYPAN